MAAGKAIGDMVAAALSDGYLTESAVSYEVEKIVKMYTRDTGLTNTQRTAIVNAALAAALAELADPASGTATSASIGEMVAGSLGTSFTKYADATGSNIPATDAEGMLVAMMPDDGMDDGMDDGTDDGVDEPMMATFASILDDAATETADVLHVNSDAAGDNTVKNLSDDSRDYRSSLVTMQGSVMSVNGVSTSAFQFADGFAGLDMGAGDTIDGWAVGSIILPSASCWMMKPMLAAKTTPRHSRLAMK